MNLDDFRPLHASECWTLCAECGERMEELHGRFECVVMDCPEYIRVVRGTPAEDVAEHVETYSVLAHARDHRPDEYGYEEKDEVA